jgi:hypothetical protein
LERGTAGGADGCLLGLHVACGDLKRVAQEKGFSAGRKNYFQKK